MIRAGLIFFWAGLIFLSLAVNVVRFAGLERSPPGFHVDELGGAVTVQCLVTEGRDAKGDARLPLLFSDLKFGTPKPPTYIYPAMLWTRIFGFSISSFRGFIAFVTVLTIAGLVVLAGTLMGRSYAVLVAVVASISPWAWMFSRIAYEPMLGPCFMVWGMVVFFRSRGPGSAFLSGLLFAGAMYSYPPMRLQIPLLAMSLVIFAALRKNMTRGYGLLFAATLALAVVPLVYYILVMDFQSRFNVIGIFSEKYLASIGKTGSFTDLGGIFLRNYFSHFSPAFLFFKGSGNAMHSSGFVGILSWTESAAVAGGIVWLAWLAVKTKCREMFKKVNHQYLALFSVNILVSVAPSALTWEGVPHALRIISAWPFASLTTAYVLWRFVQRWPGLVVVICAVSAWFFFKFGHNYFTKYPWYAYGMYSPWSKEMAEGARTEAEWIEFVFRHRHQDYHTCYYLMNYSGDSCSGARAKWDAINRLAR